MQHGYLDQRRATRVDLERTCSLPINPVVLKMAAIHLEGARPFLNYSDTDVNWCQVVKEGMACLFLSWVHTWSSKLFAPFLQTKSWQPLDQLL